MGDIDLRLLRVFRAVVEAGGFSNAQAVLNVSQSTISTQMAQLETRLGVTLCHRGRSGFSLTDEGEACYRHVIELFRSINTFQMHAGELRGEMGGILRVAFLDNVVTDPDSPLRDLLSGFARQPGNRVRLALEVLSPQEMERRLLDHSLDVAIGIFYGRMPSLVYRPLYRETDSLVCTRDHPLAAIHEPDALLSAIAAARKVVRVFLGALEFPESDAHGGNADAVVTNVEAALHLILTGTYIGFLPRHYSRAWVESGAVVELLPEHFVRHSDFSLVTHANGMHQRAIRGFVDCLGELGCGRTSDAIRQH
ncbi:LysR family transcriptional regulator [Burkholderia sp. WAC0059]|uniref:LysR family transcriptional regulator n=1 Tax=Burkholderia sp. WAC0059 TaxID=2066022 RepID=UPI0015E095CA|nr:LysR family transcriptional regulator [Burkholderia sp. WAC0059]